MVVEEKLGEGKVKVKVLPGRAGTDHGFALDLKMVVPLVPGQAPCDPHPRAVRAAVDGAGKTLRRHPGDRRDRQVAHGEGRRGKRGEGEAGEGEDIQIHAVCS